jgi:hypothetical protein
MENTEGMTSQEGMRYLERVISISDVIILACNTSFAELEQEKNLPSGAIVRQALRLAFTYAVRNCLEYKRLAHHQPSGPKEASPLAEIVHEVKMLAHRDPVEILLDLQLHSNDNPPHSSPAFVGHKRYSDCLLQSVDILRMKALLYRDVVRNDRNKNKPFVIVVSNKKRFFVKFLLGTSCQ